MSARSVVVCARQFGPPATVARVEEWELPAVGEGEVLVEVLAAPIHPADLNLLEGSYGVRPALPFVGGIEGLGRLADGRRVIAPIQLGWWCEQRVLPAAVLMTVPPSLPDDVAAMLTINPPTAYRLLHDFVTLQPGEWIIQNAANSGVGRAVIELARHRGWRTINVVRRPSVVDELRALGADVVLLEAEPWARQVDVPVRLGLNAVGGESARQMARALAPGGVLVTYGAMSRQPVVLDNRCFIFRDLTCRGFWLSAWYRRAGAECVRMFEELFALAAAGMFRVPVVARYQLRDATAALTRALAGGKVLFTRECPRDEKGNPRPVVGVSAC